MLSPRALVKGNPARAKFAAENTGKMSSLYWIKALVAIPLKSIPMSQLLPEMPAECQTVQMCPPLTALALRWHCADFNCLFSWPWWRHRGRSDPLDTKSESKILSTLLTPLLLCGLLRTLSTLTFWSTMEVLSFHVHRPMPHYTAFCKWLYKHDKFSDSFAHNCEYLNAF